MTKIIKFIIISALLWASPAQAGPLHDAAREGNSAEIIRLLDALADIHARTEEGITPLHMAAIFGRSEAITLLLNAGVDVDARGEGGITPLHGAAHEGQSEAITLLLNAGADARLQDNCGLTPLDLIEEDTPLYKSSIWWRLRDAQFNGPKK